MSRYFLLISCLIFVCVISFKAEAQSNSKADNDGITLKRLFPKESFFGPSARSTEFSLDGRYAAYLYRPYNERRHGNDLWIYDFKTKTNKRITSLAIMAQFQRSARVVKRDRLAKHKKSLDEKNKTNKKDSQSEAKKSRQDSNKKKSKTDDEVVKRRLKK